MRILLTCHRDPFTNVGGSEYVVRSMALHLARRGHKVTVATRLVPGQPIQGIFGNERVEVIRFDVDGGGSVWRTNKRLAEFFASPEWEAVVLYGQNVWCTDHVWREVGNFSGQVLYFPVGFLGLKRSYPLPVRMRNRLYYSIVQKHLIETADSTLAVTNDEARDIVRLAKPRNLALVPNGIDMDHFVRSDSMDVRDAYRIRRDADLILNVGGDYGNKRLRLAIEAMDYIPGKVQLVLVGPGTEPYDGGCGGRVRGLGVIPEADKVALYRHASMVLQVSDFEGFGISLLEALACGVPFVSTRVGAAEELARRFDGILIRTPNPDPRTVAAAVKRELEFQRNPGTLQLIASDYDWSRVIDQLEGVMDGSADMYALKLE